MFFESELKKRVQLVDDFIHAYFASLDLPQSTAVAELKGSMFYSASAGGKRFRPVLSLLVGEAVGGAAADILPFACAVEFVHTYSLIHDDLPCMDDDDFRRGKATNHKVYGETTALLAGDALLTEAFLLVAENYQGQGRLSAQLCALLSRAAGIRGMVGGQAIDLQAKDLSLDDLTNLHELKTGRMIQVAAEGAALIGCSDALKIQNFTSFGRYLGLAFQIADDVLDQNDKDQGPRSFVTLLGIEGTQRYLAEVSEKAMDILRHLPQRSAILEQMIEFNLHRQL